VGLGERKVSGVRNTMTNIVTGILIVVFIIAAIASFMDH